VGLVSRTLTTIAGPRTLELIYARLGGVTVVSAPEVAFSLAIDRAVYVIDPQRAAPTMTARLTLRAVHQAEPLRLTFPSGQRFDLGLKNERGDVVYRWSEGKFFTLAIGTETLSHGEKNYVVAAPLAGKDSRPLPPGNYVAEGWLTTMGPRAYSASVGFEIRPAP